LRIKKWRKLWHGYIERNKLAEFKLRHAPCAGTNPGGSGFVWMSCNGNTANSQPLALLAKGQGRVKPVDILEAALIRFYKLPLDEQLELVRRYRDR
jgi:hypothetical protein